MSSHTSRVIVLVDMDCFYCQVEERLEPSLTGKPIAVVQYNAWKGGGIIAVNYPARDRGVTRHMRGVEAKQKCSEIELVRVPTVRGKADLTKYREAGKRVAEVLQTFTSLLQRASVDEAYLDITEAVNQRLTFTKRLTTDKLQNTHVVGCTTADFLYNIYNDDLRSDSNIKLAIGGVIVEEIRATVYKKTGYRCSAGIAHNKILAKLACGLYKPNQQTILPQDGVEELYKTLPLKKIKSLGGKFGESLSAKLKINYMSELARFSEQELLKIYDDKTALWLYNIARGIDLEPVTVRLISKSIGCCKKFPGKAALKTTEEVNHWLSELTREISERLEQDLEENNRRAKQIVLSYAQQVGRKDVHSSKSQPLNSYDASKILNDCFETLKKCTQKSDGSFCLKFLGISVGKFEDCKNVSNISSYFKPASKLNGQESDSNNTAGVSDKTATVPQDISSNVMNQSPDKQFLEDSECMRRDNTSTNAKTEEDAISEDISNEICLNDIENDIEDDTSLDLEQTLKDLESIKKLEDGYFSDATVEGDFSEILSTKNELDTSDKCADTSIKPTNENATKIVDETSQDNSNFGDTSKSFFMRYIQNLHANKEVTLSTMETKPSCSNLQTNSNGIDSNDSSSSSVMLIDENSESSLDFVKKQCPECNKTIATSEYISHMDFHVAMRFMEEEKKQFREQLLAERQKQSSNVSAKSTKTKSVKRKSQVVDTKNTLTSFLCTTNKENDSNDGTVCDECGKCIKKEDYASHLDFHAAKKLHLELNPVQVLKFPDNNLNKRKKTSKSSSEAVNSIVKFFKPVQN